MHSAPFEPSYNVIFMRAFLSVLNHNNFVGRNGIITKISLTTLRTGDPGNGLDGGADLLMQ